MEARTSISEVPDTGKEEKTNPRPPERAAEGGQVRFDDEKLIGMVFVMMGLAGGKPFQRRRNYVTLPWKPSYLG